jgi:hypothetical protein
LDTRSADGGSLKLRELIWEHTSEFAYDFRTKFGLSYLEIGATITWLEVMHLVSMLLRDPTSWLQTAVRGWKHPVDYEWIVAANTFDLLARANSGKKKPKPYPTPWAVKEDKLRPKYKQSRSDVIAKLKLMNPKENNGA